LLSLTEANTHTQQHSNTAKVSNVKAEFIMKNVQRTLFDGVAEAEINKAFIMMRASGSKKTPTTPM
jgi:hypothetical protein